jgi:hypothetical protein
MLKDILRKLSLLGQGLQPLDRTKFNDPLALTIEWTPASGGGANFRTHKLVEVEFSRVEFKAAIGARLFYALFFFVGLGMGIAFTVENKIFEDFSLEAIAPVLFSLIFVIVGGLLYYFGTSPIVFDKQRGYFWKGRKSPQDVYDKASIKKIASLGDIHAIQLVSEYIRGSKSSYYSYELNLVLKDGKRITVIDHGNLNRLREDAKKLSEFLGKPVWDAI